jgi:uncharacterized membrane protein YbhN (UPF0104 family)
VSSADSPLTESADAQPGCFIHAVARIPTPAIFVGAVGVAFALLWQQGKLGDVGHAIRGANPWAIIAGFILYLIGMALASYRWHVLVVMAKGVSEFPKAAEAYLTSIVVNYAAPIGLAVPTRAALTKRALGLTAAETSAVALWEVGVDVIVLGLGTLLWLGLGGWNGDVLPDVSHRTEVLAAVVVAGGALVCLAGLAVVVSRKPTLVAKARGMLYTFITFPLRRPREAVYATLITIAYWVIQGMVMILLLDALGVDWSATLVLGMMSLPILVGMLSPVPGGAGIREALMVGVARVHGADSALVLLAAVSYRVALFISVPILYSLVRVQLRSRARLDAAESPPRDKAVSRFS